MILREGEVQTTTGLSANDYCSPLAFSMAPRYALEGAQLAP